ncbi:MAG: hypothetical protein ACRCVT_05710 [Leadbetterella sp.]
MKKTLFIILMIGWAGLSVAQNIVKVEYFIDTDPGYGNGTEVSITAGTTVTTTLNIPISVGLSEGFHKIHVRARNATGQWSMVQQQSFFKMGAVPSVPNIVKLEYFIDTDPGFGLATSMPITANTTLDLENISFGLPNTLSFGTHTFYLRTQDAQGKWSIVANKEFTNCNIGASLTATPTVASCGSPITINTTFQNPNTLALTWQWFRDGVFMGTAQNNQSSLITTTSGAYSIKISTTANGACNEISSNHLPVTILINDSVRINSSATYTNCNAPVTLNVDNGRSNISTNEGVSYIWLRNNATFATTPSITTTQGGTYKLIINYLGNLSSCPPIESNSIIIEEKQPTISLSPVTTLPNIIQICSGSSVELSIQTDLTGTLAYQWYKDNVLQSGQTGASIILNNAPGIYRAEVSIGLCTSLTSGDYPVSFSGTSPDSPAMNLVSGTASTCSGEPATLTVTGCGGEVTWSNGFVGVTQTVIQLNQASTYQAFCRNGCLKQVASPVTMTPLSPTLAAPTIVADDYPLGSTYTVKQGGIDSHAEFIYNTFNPSKITPTSTVSLEGGRVYYSGFRYGGGPTFNLNAFDKSQQMVFGQDVSSGVPNSNANDITLLSNGHLLLTGNTTSGIVGDKTINSFGGNDFWVVAKDLEGYRVWDRAFGGSGNDFGNKTLKLPSGNLLVCGTSNSPVSGNKTAPNRGNSDLWVVKTDALGNYLADFSYGGTAADSLTCAIVLSNGNIALVGSSLSGPSGNKTSPAFGNEDIWLVVINENGAIVSENTVGTVLSENSLSIVEKNAAIYISSSGDSGPSTTKHLYKFSLVGILLDSKKYQFTPYSSDNEHIRIQKLHLSPSGDLLAVARVNGTLFQDGITQLGQYDYISFFEVSEDLTVINTTKTNFNSSFWGDYFYHSFFDADGQFHLIVSKCNDCNYICSSCQYTQFDYATPYSPSSTSFKMNGIGGIFSFSQFVVSKYNFQTVSFTDFCRGKEFLVKAILPTPETARNIDFKWSNNAQGQIIKATPQERQPLRVAYKVHNQVPCGSPVASFNLLPYGDRLTVMGNNFSNGTKKFAYQAVSSSENLNISGSYQSEGAILLNPGFKITATPTTTFRANIAGCN